MKLPYLRSDIVLATGPGWAFVFPRHAVPFIVSWSVCVGTFVASCILPELSDAVSVFALLAASPLPVAVEKFTFVRRTS